MPRVVEAEDQGLLNRPADLLPIGEGPHRIAPAIDIDAMGAGGLGEPDGHGGTAHIPGDIGGGVHFVDRIEAREFGDRADMGT